MVSLQLIYPCGAKCKVKRMVFLRFIPVTCGWVFIAKTFSYRVKLFVSMNKVVSRHLPSLLTMIGCSVILSPSFTIITFFE